MSQEKSDNVFKRQEDSLKYMKEHLKEKINMFLSEKIQNKVINLRKSKANIYSSDQSFEKQET